jgi:hypothetical protein
VQKQREEESLFKGRLRIELETAKIELRKKSD